MKKEVIIDELKSGNSDPLASWLDTIDKKEELSPSDNALMDEVTVILIKLLDDEKSIGYGSKYAEIIDKLLSTVSKFLDARSFAMEITCKIKASAKHHMRPDYFERCKQGDTDAVESLQRDELRALLYCITKGVIIDENQKLIGSILSKLVDKAVASRKQILEALLKSTRIITAHEVTTYELITTEFGIKIVASTKLIEDCDECPCRSECKRDNTCLRWQPISTTTTAPWATTSYVGSPPPPLH